MGKTQPRASVYFEEKLNDKIEAECEQTRLSKNKLIVKIIEEYFERKEVSAVSEPAREYCASKYEVSDLEERINKLENEVRLLKKRI